jgi:DNA-directed RNA polymerase subunit F
MRIMDSNERGPHNKRALTLAEVKALVFDRWSSAVESLTLDQRRLLIYLSKFTKVSDPKRAREAVEGLMNKFKLKEEHAVMLVNVLPEDEEELRAYLFKDYPLLSQQDYKEMLNLLKSLRG